MSLLDIFKRKTKGFEDKVEKSWFVKLKDKLSKASGFFNKIFALFDSSEVDYDLLESMLLDADIDYETTKELIGTIKDASKKEKIDGIQAKEIIKQHLLKILQSSYKRFDLEEYSEDRLKVVFLCGINGGGKTTSIAKIASMFKSQYKTLLVGCDSFRVAANEQLNIWADRLGLKVFDSTVAVSDKQPTIAYKSIDYGNSNEYQLLLIDTSGRMANNSNLMDELKKTSNVLKKHNINYPQETILVLDGTQGQNILDQVEKFDNAVKLTGLIITKLDGISKGGIIISVSRKYKLPIYFIGVGEHQDDINYFNPEEFVDSLLD